MGAMDHRVWTFLLAVFAICQPVYSNRVCDRVPVGISSPKTPGNNGFTLSVAGNPKNYVPEETYKVNLRGKKTSHSVQKFVGFMISVHRKDGGDHSAGTFQPLGDAVAKFSDTCPNSMVHASPVPKSEVEVLWKAPKKGSGCVEFKATLLEYHEVWYMDDDLLNHELCEEITPPPTAHRMECCACDEAKYELTFQGTWSKHTHPKDFPEHLFETHFSDIIGASHNSKFTMWAPGGIATKGLEDVAEMGSNRAIESEMKQQADNIRTIIKARGLWYPKLNSSAFAVFNVDRRHHLISVVSMLGPSPDWIVGVSGLDLCIMENCSWVPKIVYDLYPWDAGTDSGVTYTSDDIDTNPKEPIRQITSSYPNKSESPFFDAYGVPMKPVAKLTVTMQRRYEKSCTAPASGQDPEIDIFETESPEDPRVECMTTEWSEYSPCSVTCGKGKRMATRAYKNHMKATMNMCKTELVKADMCMGHAGHCESVRCATGPWSEWTECSEECGMGYRTRTRQFLERKSRKTCFDELEETEPCKGPRMNCEPSPTFDPQCAVTQWSQWSPCAGSCGGNGETMRTRMYLRGQPQNCNIEMMQKSDCKLPACGAEHTRNMCIHDKDVGPCRGKFERWYFNTSTKSCQRFTYGGCKGNPNKFDTYQDCKDTCDMSAAYELSNRVPASPVVVTYTLRDRGTAHVDKHHGLVCVPIESTVTSPHDQGDIVDCMVTPWVESNPCSRTCGKGRKIEHRMIKVYPKNGGKMCPKKLARKKTCNLPPCPKNKHDARGI